MFSCFAVPSALCFFLGHFRDSGQMPQCLATSLDGARVVDAGNSIPHICPFGDALMVSKEISRHKLLF
jgi:hypothetical protein